MPTQTTSEKNGNWSNIFLGATAVWVVLGLIAIKYNNDHKILENFNNFCDCVKGTEQDTATAHSDTTWVGMLGLTINDMNNIWIRSTPFGEFTTNWKLLLSINEKAKADSSIETIDTLSTLIAPSLHEVKKIMDSLNLVSRDSITDFIHSLKYIRDNNGKGKEIKFANTPLGTLYNLSGDDLDLAILYWTMLKIRWYWAWVVYLESPDGSTTYVMTCIEWLSWEPGVSRSVPIQFVPKKDKMYFPTTAIPVADSPRYYYPKELDEWKISKVIGLPRK